MSRNRSSIALAAMILLAACTPEDATGPSFKYGPPEGGGGGGGGKETTLGNNLSNPVVFAEGYGITGLPITTGAPASTGLRTPSTATWPTLPDFLIDPTEPVVTQDGSPVYCQKTGHVWMPQWVLGATDAVVDWGDNLTSVQFTSTSIVRVETVLFAPGTMTGYGMFLFSGAQRTEQQ